MAEAARGPDDTAAAVPGLAPGELALLASVFVVAACGLLYELAAGALASYLLGDSVLQFSTVIGAYLFAMGLGSWLSRFVERQLVAQFLRIELLVGLIGGLMPAALFVVHSTLPAAAVAPSRSSTVTAAPSRLNRRQVAAPIPEPPPVTSTWRPANLPIGSAVTTAGPRPRRR